MFDEEYEKFLKGMKEEGKDHTIDAIRYAVECLGDFGILDEIEEMVEDDMKEFIPVSIQYNGDITTVMWRDGDKSILKRMPEDRNDPQKAFLVAFFQKFSGLKKKYANEYLSQLGDNSVSKINFNGDHMTKVKRIKKKPKKEKKYQAMEGTLKIDTGNGFEDMFRIDGLPQCKATMVFKGIEPVSEAMEEEIEKLEE